MQQFRVTDPDGYGLMVIEDPYAPSKFEIATRGDYPQTQAQFFDELGKSLCLLSLPLSVAFVLATGYMMNVFG